MDCFLQDLIVLSWEYDRENGYTPFATALGLELDDYFNLPRGHGDNSDFARRYPGRIGIPAEIVAPAAPPAPASISNEQIQYMLRNRPGR